MHHGRVCLKLDLAQRWKPGGDSQKLSRTWVAIFEYTGRDGQRAWLSSGDDIHGRWRCMVRKYRPLLLPVSVDYGGSDTPTDKGASGERDRVDGDGSWHEKDTQDT